MAFGKRFLPHSVQLKTNTGTINSWIDQIQSVGPDQGVSLFEESAGSATDREFVASKDIVPTMGFETTDLSVLGTVGFSGLLIDSAASKPGLVAYGRELPLGALPTAIATANHLKMAVSDGLLVPTSIQAGHNQAARLSLMLHALLGTAGTSGVSPMIFTKASAINSGAGGVTKLYTAGVIKFNSRLVKGVISQAVQFGLNVFKESTDGDVYPSFASIIARDPVIEFTTRDTDLADEVSDGLALTSFGCYFRAVNQNGQRIAEATTSHIGITGTTGMILPGAVSLQNRSAESVSLRIVPAAVSSIIAVSTSAAIPTT